MHRKFQVGCPCCDDCPSSCAAPDLASTGSTAANSAWYLIPDDQSSVTYQDRASYHAIPCAYSSCVDFTALIPGQTWAKFRSYFAYLDADNHAYVEVWGVLSLSPTTIAWTISIVFVDAGVETTVATHTKTLGATNIRSPMIAVAYDESTARATIVCLVRYDTATWQTYDSVDMSGGEYYDQSSYGIQYGWGYGEIDGDADDLATPSTENNLRYIDFCQGFPQWYSNGTSTLYHPWIKASVLAAETILVDADGIGSCSACNDQMTLRHPAEIYQGTVYDGSRTAATTFDMFTDEIETGWTGTLPSTLGGYAIDWLLSFRLKTGQPLLRQYVELEILGRYRYTFGGTTYYGGPLSLASQLIGFAGECASQEYDARDTVDGLTFDNWTLYDWDRWILGGGTPGVPDLSAIEAVLTLP